MNGDNWKHRSKGLRCDRCMWYALKRKLEDGSIGRCRKHAPVVGEGYPVVFGSDWCGDHKLDETLMPERKGEHVTTIPLIAKEFTINIEMKEETRDE